MLKVIHLLIQPNQHEHNNKCKIEHNSLLLDTVGPCVVKFKFVLLVAQLTLLAKKIERKIQFDNFT